MKVKLKLPKEEIVENSKESEPIIVIEDDIFDGEEEKEKPSFQVPEEMKLSKEDMLQ